MSDKTGIEWTDATWNPITGCSVVSPGCTNCYAMRLAGTRLKHHPSRAGLTVMTKAGPVWNGAVRVNENWLDQPLRWKRARRIFVCAHGDLFHESVPYEWIDLVFAVMALCPQHSFQVLTKRSALMRAYLCNPDTEFRIYSLACDIVCDPDGHAGGRLVLIAPGSDPASAPPGTRIFLDLWPLPNVWLGVSAEDQARADERIPDLLDTPAAVRFVSAEPLLGALDLTPWLYGQEKPGLVGNAIGWRPPLDWAIAGGESGPGARDVPIGAFYALRDQCRAAGVPFFMKQMARKAAIPDDLLVRQWPGEAGC